MKRFLGLVILFLVSVQFIFAQQNHALAFQIIEERGELHFSFQLPENTSINSISNSISIDRIDFINTVYAYANIQEFNLFIEYKIPYKIEISSHLVVNPLMASSMADFVQGWSSYPTYDQYDSLMQKWANDYPNLCHYHVIGTLPSGREILALQIGDSAHIHQQEPRFLYTASLHGDELTSYVLMLRFIDYLLSNYGQNSQVDKILNGVELWVNPLANPDGAYYAGNNTLSGAKRYNDNLVDLNRNFPDPKAGPHPDGNSWQPETQIFMNLADSLHFTMSANLHGGVEVLNYPWDTWSQMPSDSTWWLYVCHQYADTAQFYGWSNYFTGPTAANGTGVVNGYQWYSVYGGRQDYMNYFQRCREVTLEISKNKIPNGSDLPNYWNANYRSILNYLDQIRFGLSGIITDSLTGNPIAGKVVVNTHDKDSSHVRNLLPYGDYYRLLDMGNYSVTYSAPHYYSKTVNVSIARDSLTIQNVALVPDPTSFRELSLIDFELFPNPTSGVLHISSNDPIKQIQLLSMDGKCLFEQNYQSEKRIMLSLPQFKKGVYIIRLNSKEVKMGYRKLIIQ